MSINKDRCRRLIDQAIAKLELDLSDLTVLTEAASGYYMLTPFIAALAGAEQVYALTRDSRYGSAEQIRTETMALAVQWGLDKQIEILHSRSDKRIQQADVVTNLGFVRPLDAPFLAQLKSTVAIPLMWETWEFRPEDLDLEECRRLGIPVLGTDEHHPYLEIFDYVGYIALKMLFELKIEVFQSQVIVLGTGEFANIVIDVLQQSKARVVHWAELRKNDEQLTEDRLKHVYNADAIVVVEHHDYTQLIGHEGLITATELQRVNPSLAIAHICGNVDQSTLKQVNLYHLPANIASPGYMSVSTDYVGPRPLVDLHTAGLKVGEELARSRLQGFDAWQTETNVLRGSSLAQGFANYHDI